MKTVLLIIIAVCAYFMYANFDFETKTFKTTDRIVSPRSGGATQQMELHEAAKNL